MATLKATFTLDPETTAALDRLAARKGKPKSAIVRDAVMDYSARQDRLGETERRRMLAEFDALVPKIQPRAGDEVDAELRDLRAARRAGGRASGSAGTKPS